jgi:hypothetical protein
VSILIRVGDGERAGRAPSKVLTSIIRPPQQGHRCAGGTPSVSLSASAGECSGGALGGEQLAGALDVARSNGAGDEAVPYDSPSPACLSLLSHFDASSRLMHT